jgi:hypothetical protein
MGRTVDYPAMKRLDRRRMPQIAFVIVLTVVLALAALIYYGRLLWLLLSPD